MKCLSIQIQPNLDIAFTPQDAIDRARLLGRYPEVDIIEEGGVFVNLNFFSEDVARLWRDLREGLFEDEILGSWIKKTSIVVCEGETGWDDYLLLWHWDSVENLDGI